MFDEIVNAGNDMARAVNDAVSSGDFSHLNDDLRDSAQRMSDTLKQEGQQAVRSAQDYARATRQAASDYANATKQAAQGFANSAKSGFSSTPYVDLNGADVRVGKQGAGAGAWTSAGNTSAQAGNAGTSGQTVGTNPYGGTNTRGSSTFSGAWTRPNGGRQTPPQTNTRNTYAQGSAQGQRVNTEGSYTQAKSGQYSSTGDLVNRSARVNRIKSGEGKNIALTIVGLVGMAINFPLMISSISELASHSSYIASLDRWTLGAAIFFGICAGAFTFLLGTNISSIRLRNFANLVDTAAGEAEYISVEDLAARLAMPVKTVQKYLRRIMGKGLLPGARIDIQATTVMFSDRAYKEYRQAEDGRIEREAAARASAKEKKAEEARTRKEESESTGNAQVDEILSQGRDYIRTIREINDEIPDTEAMSDKLYTLEDIVKRIMDQVRKDPSSAGNVGMLMSYYLPTTVKLLNAYVSLKDQPAGSNVDATKKNIEESMDTINTACLKVLDDMFADVAWDVSSDINVMKQMMARDGLTEPAGAKKD